MSDDSKYPPPPPSPPSSKVVIKSNKNKSYQYYYIIITIKVSDNVIAEKMHVPLDEHLHTEECNVIIRNAKKSFLKL